ncbi:MAG TPA: site-specific integrase [Solirubrobacterales bacterium]|nr:site-specific integrase [Solirubrobacterales bacterium]
MAAKLEKTRYPGIYKRGSRYVITWEHRGRQHKESFRTIAEAREAKSNRIAVEKRPRSRIRFGEYFDGWIVSYAGRTSRGFSETTRPEYRRPIETEAIPAWGTWKLVEIEPADVRELFARMREAGRSTAAIKKLRAALSAMFATAVDDNLIRLNPVTGVRIPAALEAEPEDEEKAKALTRVELRTLIASIPTDWRLFFEFLTHTGLRISEAVGLRWEDLDLGERPQVRVREQVYEGKRKKLKSSNGRRDLPLSPAMTRRLLEQRPDSYRWEKSPVFASGAGTELRPSNVYRRVLAPAAIAVGLYVEVDDGKGGTRKRSAVSFHTFRHTCASLLFDRGKNPKQVQRWLGHHSPSFTLDKYVHLMDEGLGDAGFLDDVFGDES